MHLWDSRMMESMVMVTRGQLFSITLGRIIDVNQIVYFYSYSFTWFIWFDACKSMFHDVGREMDGKTGYWMKLELITMSLKKRSCKITNLTDCPVCVASPECAQNKAPGQVNFMPNNAPGRVTCPKSPNSSKPSKLATRHNSPGRVRRRNNDQIQFSK